MVKSNNKTNKRKSNTGKKQDLSVINSKRPRTTNTTTIQWRKISSSLPQFLDAESNVTAAKFGARRLPEMKSLWRNFMYTDAMKEEGEKKRRDTSYYESGGCKTSQRHLRRRTGSRNRKKRHRFPADNNAKNDETKDEECKKKCEPKSRKARRKPAILKKFHSQWKHTTVSICKNRKSDDTEKNDNNNLSQYSNWIETHLWHTKRFHMSPPLSIFNNWCIPLGHTNRGSRAALRLAKTKSTIQDATWMIGGRAIIIESNMKKTIIDILERICGGNKNHSAPFLLNQNVLAGLEVGHGFIYDLKCSFPSGMVGPATFLFGRGENSIYYCKVVVHSSIQGAVLISTQQLVNVVKKKVPESGYICRVKNDALALLKVRGLDATNAIVQSICSQKGKTEKDLACLDWDILSQNNKVHMLLKHGTIVPLNGLPSDKNIDQSTHCMSNEGKIEANEEQNIDAYVTDIQQKIISQDLTTPKIQNSSMILISQCPNKVMNEKTMNMNIAVSGWDILCDPEVARDLFLALNNYGGACSIGLVEASTFAMEANPPLPLWPRDYPDSRIGIEYWSNNSDEWKLIRYCIEEGMHGGRIKTVMYRLIRECSKSHLEGKEEIERDGISGRWNHEKISWHDLESNSSDDNENQATVVIKGSFVTPFVQALSGWCPRELLHCQNIDIRRRPRRKVRGLLQSIIIPPLQRERAEAQKKMCLMLSSSLSMSALLRCHIVVDGKGKLSTGMTIGSYQKENKSDDSSSDHSSDSSSLDNIFGYVVSGMFSQNRGCYHGVGFISSKRFLSNLTDGGNGCFTLHKEFKGSSLVVALKVCLFSKSSNDFSIGHLMILPN